MLKFTWTFVAAVANNVVTALTKMVPTNEPSGINAYEPAFPKVAISSSNLLSKLYPKPNVFTVHVKLVFFFSFSNVGKWPRGGSIFGQPSVRRKSAALAPVARWPLVKTSRPARRPSHRFVWPLSYRENCTYFIESNLKLKYIPLILPRMLKHLISHLHPF